MKLRIDFSIYAKPIEEQLKELGYKFENEKDIERYNKFFKSWNTLRLNSIATDGECDKMAKRILKKLKEDIVVMEQGGVKDESN